MKLRLTFFFSLYFFDSEISLETPKLVPDDIHKSFMYNKVNLHNFCFRRTITKKKTKTKKRKDFRYCKRLLDHKIMCAHTSSRKA
jgi:hypothetical protein